MHCSLEVELEGASVTISERSLIIRQSPHHVHHTLVHILGTDFCGEYGVLKVEHYARNQLILFFKDNRRGLFNLLHRFGSLGSMQGIRGGGHAAVMSLLFFSFLNVYRDTVCC